MTKVTSAGRARGKVARAAQAVKSLPPTQPSPQGGEGLSQRGHGLTKEDIVAAAKRIGTVVKKPYVTRHDLIKGGLTTFKVMRHFDRWTELYRAAGLTRYPKNEFKPDALIFRAMHDAFLKLGGVKTRQAMVRVYGHSSSLLMLRFGKWREALLAFRAWCEKEEPGFPYFDQLPEAESGAGPGTVARDRFSRAGRPKKVWSVAGAGTGSVNFGVLNSGPGPVPDPDPAPDPAPVKREIGEFIHFRWLTHAPVNEAGVVLLFGMIAGEIGYAVDTIQAGFPDCEGKRRVSASRWERVRIEFEYKSRNFLKHAHDPKGCDLIVCWEHDWPECPLEVIELKAVVRGLHGEVSG